jgi:hypothetical protein
MTAARKIIRSQGAGQAEGPKWKSGDGWPIAPSFRRILYFRTRPGRFRCENLPGGYCLMIVPSRRRTSPQPPLKSFFSPDSP